MKFFFSELWRIAPTNPRKREQSVHTTFKS